jgi:putative flavoprotein involved in K+ transport
MTYLRRGSGYYADIDLDVGAGRPIIDGKIKLAHGNVKEITEDTVVLVDGQCCRRK